MTMKRKIWRIILIVLLLALAWLAISVFRNWDTIQRVFLGGVKVYETEAPAIPADLPRPAILVFSKTNAFRHEEAIPAAADMFETMARQKGWGIFHTENGATFSPEILARFDAVIFSNTSGDVFTPDQRAAFQAFVEGGGGYVGIHAAGDNSHEGWPWYVRSIIGTNFTGHPMDPQFQQATIKVEDRTHPATAHLGETWQRTDEWYSFDASPRNVAGVNILATLDESTYSQEGWGSANLSMGADHPIMWWRCAGQGRVFYTALGHTAESFTEAENVAVLTGAVEWALGQKGDACGAAPVAEGETSE
jgi:type 1 glutamine amidotransferase